MTTTLTSTSLAASVAPVRARHHELITAATTWSLERGSPLDPVGVALICATVESLFTQGDRSLTRWTRPQVNCLLVCDVRNWCSFEGCLVPDGFPEAVWGFLEFLHNTSRLDPASDPLDNLREPLICYGGLGLDGKPRAPDSRQPFPCQCYLDVVPVSKPGLSRWRTAMGAVIEMWQPAPADDELVRWWMPLVEVSRDVRREQIYWPVYPDEFHFVGSLERSGRPTIWVYLHRASQGEIYVDDSGQTYRLREDRRAKIGARFEQCDLRSAVYGAGLPHVVEPIWYDEPPRRPHDNDDSRSGRRLSLVADDDPDDW